MSPRKLVLSLEGSSAVAPSLRVTQTLENAIRQGRIRPGEALPGSRMVAEMLGINRNTVIVVLQEMEAEGWLVTVPNKGTFVADPLPVAPPPSPDGNRTSHVEPGFDLPSRLSPLSALNPDALNLADGVPDARLFPAQELSKAYHRALQRHGSNLLQSGAPMGHALLRKELASWLAQRRGLVVDPGQILITRGTRSSLSLLALSLLKEGEGVAVENPGNRAAWDTLRQAGKARLHSIPVDGEGLIVDALAAVCARERIRFLLVTPQRQFPTTVAMSPARRCALLAFARAERLAIVEDDYDSDYTYGDTPLLPLASQDEGGHVVHLASLSRLIAPGLGMAFMVGPGPLIERLAKFQRALDWQTDQAMEWAIADLIRDGEVDRHLRRARKVYQSRRNFLVDGLNHRFAGRLTTVLPPGGLAVWSTAQTRTDLEAWILAAKACGLILNTPSHFHLEAGQPGTRIGFAQADLEQLGSALECLERSRPV